jgi:hypothetical protein
MRPATQHVDGQAGPTRNCEILAAKREPSQSESWCVAPNLRLPQCFAVVLGIVAALVVSGSGTAGALWGKIANAPSLRESLKQESTINIPLPSDTVLDQQEPQRQAETLLECAVAHSEGATRQIESRVDAWRGKLAWDVQLSALATAALNSKDDNVRDSAVEVQLVAYGLNKSVPTVDDLERQANASDHSRRVWALWALGLMGNRGVQTDRVVDILSHHLKDLDGKSGVLSEDARRWAVESLALVGTTATITPLLDALHNDPSPIVRERAAASLAESGMLSRNQRMLAVPQLIIFSDDPSVDAQTHLWAFQALAEITRKRLPNSSAAWRDWYQHDNSDN